MPNRANIMETSSIKQVVSSVWRKTGPTICLSVARSACNNPNKYYGRIELDSYADTNVFGCNCVVLTYTGKEWKVLPYSNEYESIQHIPVVTGATAWTFPHSEEKIILVFNKALSMGNKLEHTLVNSNQMHHRHINLQDNPCMHNPMGITCPQEDVTITLYIAGTFFGANTSSPTKHKL